MAKKKFARIVITGVPATGKTTLATALSKALSVPLVKINDFAIKRKLFSVVKGETEKTVDPKKLAPALCRYLASLNGYVVEGHLACEFSVPADAILVLRANPKILARRYAERNYPRRKSDENVLTEILDYCLLKCERNYPKARIIQIDNSKPVSAEAAIARIASKKTDFVNWMPLLLDGSFQNLQESGWEHLRKCLKANRGNN